MEARLGIDRVGEGGGLSGMNPCDRKIQGRIER